MARTNTNGETNTETNETASAVDVATLPDSTIYMMVEGHVGLLPWQAHEALNEAENVALNEGRKQIALRRAQAVAKKAKADGKDVRSEVQSFVAGFTPKADQGFQTLGERRAELGRELMAEKLEASGKEALATRIRAGDPVTDKSGKDILPGFIAKYAEEINARLGAWASAYHAPKKRGAGGAAVVGDDFDLGEL